MTAEELAHRFYFHDSILTDVKHRGNDLILTIELCMYMQKEYQVGESELKKITVEFIGVKSFDWENNFEAHDAEILELSAECNRVKIVLLGDEVSVIAFECYKVNVIV